MEGKVYMGSGGRTSVTTWGRRPAGGELDLTLSGCPKEPLQVMGGTGAGSGERATPGEDTTTRVRNLLGRVTRKTGV